jgi:myo-inositol 2-dehydrogenase / D-chiro-inositol 1-dehydrogenase
MPPIRLNRRKFFGASAAAGLALSQADEVVASLEMRSVRVGLIGLGNRGTTLLRSLLELPGVQVVAVADQEARHSLRAQGIVEKAQGARPEAFAQFEELLGKSDIEAAVIALPCDLHRPAYSSALLTGKHVFAEKPLAISVEDCDALIAEANSRPDLVFHIGYQRRSHPRFREGVELIRSGDLGELLLARASWTSSNGPINGQGGWLGRRGRSGDWMVEQAVHVWDVLHWIKSGVPCRAYGHGRRDLFHASQPDRDVTDAYSATLEWPDGFHLTYEHSWIDPADDTFTGQELKIVGTRGGIDFRTGTATFRDRSKPRAALHPGNPSDTKLALEAFVQSIRAEERVPAPVSLLEAREATITGLLVRRAVDEGRIVERSEIA